MSRITFENYGRFARSENDLTKVSGRYTAQKDCERLIVLDVAKKLELSPTDCLLEIGCGPGNLLIPISFLVHEVTGLDHKDVCSRLNDRFTSKHLRTVGANFLDYAPASDEQYDAIIIYSVVNTLFDAQEAMQFLTKAAKLLKPGGRMLVGDIANIDKKTRFLNSPDGQDFIETWNRKLASMPSNSGEKPEGWEADPNTFQPDDTFIINVIEHFRKIGMHSFILDQPSDLPFGRTREDIILINPG